ncbi:hypothetical protein KVT40_007358 [Elsinoe batatas]|uniref:Uncharacterized protein n=1 Tax=Elsinoe batatas TaxID=2601811 RepID=A0A8K0KYF9_9PEZI|nr:hypothetical protein KVT40_007358 [Elsinoe batatas]
MKTTITILIASLLVLASAGPLSHQKPGTTTDPGLAGKVGQPSNFLGPSTNKASETIGEGAGQATSFAGGAGPGIGPTFGQQAAPVAAAGMQVAAGQSFKNTVADANEQGKFNHDPKPASTYDYTASPAFGGSGTKP